MKDIEDKRPTSHKMKKFCHFPDVIIKIQRHLTTQVPELLYNQCIECTRCVSLPGWDNTDKIRIVGTDETHGYPYLVCKKRSVKITSVLLTALRL